MRKKLAPPPKTIYDPSINERELESHNAQVAEKFARQHQPQILFVRVDHVKETETNKKQQGQ